MKQETVICLPARYQSTRLPGKPLLKIAGKPLILWALDSAMQINAKQMVVATDDERIYDLVKKQGHDVVMTSKSHESGTDRLAEVSNLMNWSDETIVINYQADEPHTPKQNINQLVHALIKNPLASIATLYQPIFSYADLINPNNVKVVTDDDDYALYFSRAAIPYARNDFSNKTLDTQVLYKHHIGLYAYRARFLKQFSKLSQSTLEKTESLEQLRAMSYGYKIIVKKAIESMPHGIDTKEDIVRFENSLKNRKQ